MGNRVAGLDVVRAVAITSVVLAHGISVLYAHFPLLPYLGHLGSFGVDLFFVLSGFLIGGILWRTGPALRSPAVLWRFWQRRWLRTLPNYYFFLSVTVVLGVWFYHDSLNWSGEVLPTVFFVQNVTHPVRAFFPESWTLAIEEWFYVLTPAALCLGLRWTGRFRLVWWTVVLTMLLGPLLARLLAPASLSWASGVRMPVMFRLDSIAHGLAMAGLAGQFPAAVQRFRGIMAAVGAALAATAYVCYYSLDLEHSSYVRTFLFNQFSIGFALLMPWARSLESLGGGWCERAARAVALWSYSMYLCNFGLHVLMVRKFSPQYAGTPGGALMVFAGYLAAVFAIGAFAYRFVEMPFMRARERIAPDG